MAPRMSIWEIVQNENNVLMSSVWTCLPKPKVDGKSGLYYYKR